MDKKVQKFEVFVYRGMTTFDIANHMGEQLGCGYDEEIQKYICEELYKIMVAGPKQEHML